LQFPCTKSDRELDQSFEVEIGRVLMMAARMIKEHVGAQRGLKVTVKASRPDNAAGLEGLGDQRVEVVGKFHYLHFPTRRIPPPAAGVFFLQPVG
jgi:hypothetical protein